MRTGTWIKTAAAALGLCLLAACGGGGGAPPDEYPVGRTSLEWTDISRNEQCGGVAPGTPRRLQAYVWYPARPAAGAATSPLLTPAQASLLAANAGLPEDALRKLPSRSVADAPVHPALRQYPVLVMSHGAGAFPLVYASTAEALAAAGYVVVGLSHPHHSAVTFFADGSVVPIDPACHGFGAQPPETPTFADFTADWQAALALDRTLTGDIASAIGQLGTWNATGRFAGRLQAGRVGVFGHSFGGSHSFRAAATLPAVAAAANVDGTVFSEDFAKGVAKPYLTIAGRDGDPTGAELQAQVNQLRALGLSPQDAATVVGRGLPRAAYEASRPAYLARIPAARHQNFSDVPAWSLATGLPVEASEVNMADAREISALQDGLLIRFFDRHLRDRSEAIALPPTRLSGVTLEARP